ncbi:hypothetical protein GGS26DRAFT_382185 [Hypomontagnella submonticulosa]|nr:hypothetical protein GGS26DRAFT_382185 [Hypomontagnella submonticulosa]
MLAAAIFALAGSIIPGATSSPPPEGYNWNVVNWQAGQSHGNPADPTTGWYMFNVSGPEYGEGKTHIPSFAAHCEGFADGIPLSSNFSSCTLDRSVGTPGTSVLARVIPDPEIRAHIAITYLFRTDDEARMRRNFTVIIVEDWARERPPHNFTVNPAEATAL